MADLREYLMAYAVRESNYHRIVLSPAFEALDKQLMIALVRQHETAALSPVISRANEGGRVAVVTSTRTAPRFEERSVVSPDRGVRVTRRPSSPHATLTHRLSSTTILDLEMPLELDALRHTLEADLDHLHDAVSESIARGGRCASTERTTGGDGSCPTQDAVSASVHTSSLTSNTKRFTCAALLSNPRSHLEYHPCTNPLLNLVSALLLCVCHRSAAVTRQSCWM